MHLGICAFLVQPLLTVCLVCDTFLLALGICAFLVFLFKICWHVFFFFCFIVCNFVCVCLTDVTIQSQSSVEALLRIVLGALTNASTRTTPAPPKAAPGVSVVVAKLSHFGKFSVDKVEELPEARDATVQLSETSLPLGGC